MSQLPDSKLISIPILALGGMLFLSSCGEVENIQIEVDQPIEVEEGDVFSTTIFISNTDDEDQVLMSIDVADEYLNGMMLLSSDPPFKSSMHIPLDNTQSLEFGQTIGANQSTQVTLTFKSVESGLFRGDVDMCINSDMAFISVPLQTFVN